MPARPKFDAACAAWRRDPYRTGYAVIAEVGCCYQTAMNARAWLCRQGEIPATHSARTAAILADSDLGYAPPATLARRYGVHATYILRLERAILARKGAV